MSKFIYGAAVQGIQKFIFETNRLKEIVGASEIVDKICTEMYKEFINEDDVDVILSAAGNIKLSADSKEVFETLVKEFPKKVMENAPGITISQAVYECKDGDIDNRKNIDELEKRLRIQRNLPLLPAEVSAMGILRNRRTGKSAVKREKIKKDSYEYLDKASSQKYKASSNTSLVEKLTGDAKLSLSFTGDMGQLTSKESSWLAVVHVDGNGLGKILQDLPSLGKTLKEFSSELDKSTKEAAQIAFNQIIANKKNKEFFPIRPVVLGGDDLTVICRGDLALPFVKEFLKAFEERTNFYKLNLTACAGIAFVKESYPFHYAVNLAEELCGAAKKFSRTKSSVCFHKIQSSFVDSFESIKKRELKANDISFFNGPYTIDKNDKAMSLDDLENMVELISKKDSPKSGVRKWLSALSENSADAAQLMKRIIQITSNKYIEGLGLKEPIKEDNDLSGKKTYLYDVLTIASIKGGNA